MISETSNSCTRELSLVEQKRLQWQREREEMERMGSEIFSRSQTKYEKTSIKTYFSNVDLSMNSSTFIDPGRRQPPIPIPLRAEHPNYNYDFGGMPTAAPRTTMRSPSLPPIVREKFYNYPNSQTLIINPAPSDTGYNSETSPAEGPVEVWTNDDDGRGSNKTVTLRSRPEFYDNGNRIPRPEMDPRHAPQHFSEAGHSMVNPGGKSSLVGTPNSFSTNGGDFRGANPRRKWSDNEVHTPQSYFDPMSRSLDSRSSQNVPYWLEKGLHDIRDNVSEDESGSIRSHIRGQNIPLDPNIIAERANRRRKALELQNAIKEQLLEQERLKKWEKEKRIQEELLAEETLKQQLEAERTRLEYEKKVREEKMENERRKAEIMRLAVAAAEHEAKMEKERRKLHMKRKPNENNSVEIKDLENEDIPATPNSEPKMENTSKSLADPQPSITTVEKSPIEVRTVTPVSVMSIQPEPAATKPTDIDGIALVLQSITPMVPLANIGPDLLGLNNSVNNLQFALLLAQQQQQLNLQARQLNTISSASSILSTGTANEDTHPPNTVRDAAITNRSKLINERPQFKIENNDEEPKECAYCCRIHGHHNKVTQENKKGTNEVPDTPKVIVIEEIESVTEEKETVPQIQDFNSELELSTLELPKLPSDGTFIKEEEPEQSVTLTLDADSSTQTDNEVTGNELVAWQEPRILTPRKYRIGRNTNEMGIQTDLLLLQNCNICSHKQLILKEISQVTTSVTQTSSRAHTTELSPLRHTQGMLNKDPNNTLTTTTVTTTTTIRAKANERASRHGKKEPRPKWGVNQPSSQYVKASDRDPFCLRRRKKNQLKNYSLTDGEDEHYHKKIDSGVSSNISLEYDDGRQHEEIPEIFEMEPTNRRNICTEILPIKTDGNGQVFLNFRDSRIRKDELELKTPNGLHNLSVRERIMEKRSDDLPIIPGVFKTERKLRKSMSEYFPMEDVPKGIKNEINLSKRGDIDAEFD